MSNGLWAHLSDPFEDKTHDASTLYESGLLQDLQQNSIDTNGNIFCIYKDPAYPKRPQLQEPFGGANLNAGQRAWNEVMSSVRMSVEWLLGNIKNHFKSIDFKKNLKIQLPAIGKLYLVCSLM